MGNLRLEKSKVLINGLTLWKAKVSLQDRGCPFCLAQPPILTASSFGDDAGLSGSVASTLPSGSQKFSWKELEGSKAKQTHLGPFPGLQGWQL